MPHRGNDVPVPELTDSVAQGYDQAAAAAFGVGPSGEFTFDKATAEKWLALKKEEQEKRRRNGPMTQQFEGASDEAVEEPAAPSPRKGGKKRGGTSDGNYSRRTQE